MCVKLTRLDVDRFESVISVCMSVYVTQCPFLRVRSLASSACLYEANMPGKWKEQLRNLRHRVRACEGNTVGFQKFRADVKWIDPSC